MHVAGHAAVDQQLPLTRLGLWGRKEGIMKPNWKIVLILTAILIFAFSISLAWSAPQNSPTRVFTHAERDAIQAYYLHLMGTLAPGSINRTPFSPDVEKALTVGSHVPMQLEKSLMPLPSDLEAKLVPLTGEYGRYRLGNHVVLVRMADLTIVDIIKNAGLK
jgi:hypothetical protein